MEKYDVYDNAVHELEKYVEGAEALLKIRNLFVLVRDAAEVERVTEERLRECRIEEQRSEGKIRKLTQQLDALQAKKVEDEKAAKTTLDRLHAQIQEATTELAGLTDRSEAAKTVLREYAEDQQRAVEDAETKLNSVLGRRSA